MSDDGDEEFLPELEGLDLSDPVRRAQFAGHIELMNTAWKFLNTAVRDGDLRGAWELVYESLRTQLAQQWVIDNQADIRAGGFDNSSVVAGLAADPPSHPLWIHFERVHVRSFRQLLPDSSTWGFGANTRVVGPDLEALYVHDKSQMPSDGVWRPGAPSGRIYPLIFRRVGNRWLLAIVGDNELTGDIGRADG
jgi:hypothetical protein